RIAQFPEGSIEQEMMDVHQRGEYQKTGGEVVMKDVAHQPRPGNEQRDATGNQRKEIGNHAPARLTGGPGFALLVVTRDPDVLCGVQYSQNSAAVTRLRDLVGRAQFQKRGQ